jgi:hypothetical protein
MDDLHSIAEAVLRHEECLADLYVQLGDCFPAQGGIFCRLAIEEQLHVQYLQQLLQAVDAGQLLLRPTPLRQQNITDSMATMAQLAASASQGQATLLDVLSAARAVEMSMIEKRYFQLFDLRQGPYQALAQRLCEETLRHGEALQAQLQRLQAAGA